MKTNKKAKNTSRFIILIPHRDALRLLDGYRAKLFAAGFSGAWSFPTAAPLAELSRPFCREELREFAQNIRNLTAKNDGKIEASGTILCLPWDKDIPHGTIHDSHGTELAGCNGKLCFFGLRLNLPIDGVVFPESAKPKVLRTLFPPLLCAALLNTPAVGNPVTKEVPAFSFRAASVANLAIRHLAAGVPDFSFEWVISPVLWLPKHEKR